VDIWSCGVILFALVCGYLPFEDPNTGNLYKKILNGDYQIPKFISPECKELIQKILNTKPEERYKVSDIKKHAWFNSVEVEKVTGGIFVGLTSIPVNNFVLEKTVEYQFKKDYIVRCINQNKHNHATTTYYLLLKKYELEGKLGAEQFEVYDDRKVKELVASSKEGREEAPKEEKKKLNSTLPNTASSLRSALEKTQSIEPQKYHMPKPEEEPKKREEGASLPPNRSPNIASHLPEPNYYSKGSTHPNKPAHIANNSSDFNKTQNLHKLNLSQASDHGPAYHQPASMAGRYGAPQRGRHADQSIDKTRMHVGIETSQAERHAGVNVSYEASFSAIKNNIQKATVDHKKGVVRSKQPGLIQSQRPPQPY